MWKINACDVYVHFAKVFALFCAVVSSIFLAFISFLVVRQQICWKTWHTIVRHTGWTQNFLLWLVLFSARCLTEWENGPVLTKEEKNTSSPFKRGRARWERASGCESVTQSLFCGPGRSYNAITLHFANGVKKDKEGGSEWVGCLIYLALECTALPSFCVWCPLTNPVLITHRQKPESGVFNSFVCLFG